jgi:glyceraldehyde-3-phosphate dehydrogenase (NADP+)
MSQITTTPIPNYGFFADGSSHSSGDEVVITSVWDRSVIAVVEQATKDDALAAVDSAVRAFRVTRKLSSFQRAGILRKIARGIAAAKEDFARTICREAGKPIKTARSEVDRSIYTFDVAAEEATRIYGEYSRWIRWRLPQDAGA